MGDWFPGAEKRPVARYQAGGSSGGPMPNPRRLCLHTAVTSADSLYNLFATPGNAVAHFYVDADGSVEQYVPGNRKASANLDGNHDTISVETWDGYGTSWNGGGEGPRWTPEQVASLGRIARWANAEYGIPLARCPSSRPGTRGISWHRQGVDGNFPPGLLKGRVPGGELWSSSAGKVCPTNTRIRQVGQVIRAAKAEGAPGMTLVQRAKRLLFRAIAAADKAGNKARAARLRKTRRGLPDK